MVHSGAASAGENARSVRLEGRSVHSESHGSHSQVLLNEFLVTRSVIIILNVVDLIDSDGDLAFVKVAGHVAGLVGIVLSGHDSVSLDVLEAVSLKTSTAALVLAVSETVDQLLLGKREGLITRSNSISGFDLSSGGEGPAGSAGSLVFDRGDVSQFDVVDIFGDGVVFLGNVALALGGFSGQVNLSKLFVSEVRKLVHGESGFGVLEVQFSDLLEVLLEN